MAATECMHERFYFSDVQVRGHYPAFVKALENRHIMYNHTLDKLRQMEDEGSAFVIAPQAPVPVKSTSKNKEKLQALYDTGYLDASRCFDRLLEFLEK